MAVQLNVSPAVETKMLPFAQGYWVDGAWQISGCEMIENNWLLVGGWTNPSENYGQNGFIFPK